MKNMWIDEVFVISIPWPGSSPLRPSRPRIRSRQRPGDLAVLADDAALLVDEGALRARQTSGGGLEKRIASAPPRARNGP